MAKKVVASLQAAGKEFAKVIRMRKSDKNDAYSFTEATVPQDKVQEFLAKR